MFSCASLVQWILFCFITLSISLNMALQLYLFSPLHKLCSPIWGFKNKYIFAQCFNQKYTPLPWWVHFKLFMNEYSLSGKQNCFSNHIQFELNWGELRVRDKCSRTKTRLQQHWQTIPAPSNQNNDAILQSGGLHSICQFRFCGHAD